MQTQFQNTSLVSTNMFILQVYKLPNEACSRRSKQDLPSTKPVNSLLTALNRDFKVK